MKCLVFAPGIMGSVLYNNKGQVWPPSSWEIITGYDRIEELLGDDIYPVEPIQSIWPYDVYGSLIEDIKACGYADANDNKQLILFPYDWRQSNIITANKLADILDHKFSTMNNDLQITLLGHSMGGLVMRYLLESGEFNDRKWFSNIKQLITMGTPHFGAPLALLRLGGTDSSLGLSGSDIKYMANDSRYSSTYELVSPKESALTIQHPSRGNIPTAIDPFNEQIIARLDMNLNNIAQARIFWSKLNIINRPDHINYHFIVSSAIKTYVRNEWINSTYDPKPIEQKSSGDGTVPISSACLPGITHIFSQKKHTDIFKDRQVREYLYQYLDAPASVHPQSADKISLDELPDAIGLSVNKEVYNTEEVIEVVVSFKHELSNPVVNFELIKLDSRTGTRTNDAPRAITIILQGVSISVFSFSIKENLLPGLYELRSTLESDDPAPTIFFVRENNI